MILIIICLREKLFLCIILDLLFFFICEKWNFFKLYFLLFLLEKSILIIVSCFVEIVNILCLCERIGNVCVNNRFVFYGYYFEY